MAPAVAKRAASATDGRDRDRHKRCYATRWSATLLAALHPTPGRGSATVAPHARPLRRFSADRDDPGYGVEADPRAESASRSALNRDHVVHIDIRALLYDLSGNQHPTRPLRAVVLAEVR